MEATNTIEQADYDFRSYGLITFIVMPLIVTLFLIIPGVLFFAIIFSLILYQLEKRLDNKNFIGKLSRFFARITYFFVRVTFGLRVSKKNPKQIRFYWFFLLGAPLTFIAAAFTFVSFAVVIPAIFVLFKRKQTLRLFFRIAFLPRGEYFNIFLPDIPTKEQIQKQIDERLKLEDTYQYSNQYEYYQFYPPNRIARVSAYVILLLIPLILNILAIFIINAITGRNFQGLVKEAFDTSLVYGYIAIIPYILLSLFRENRFIKYVTTEIAESVVKGLAYSSSSSIPMISGDYFIERNSRSMDMHHNFGFFEIFRDGRILTMILLPLSIYSFIFGQLIEDSPNNDLDVEAVIATYKEIVEKGTLPFFILIILPIIISIILPLTWVLADAEIKRATWTNDEGPVDEREISGVEDLGKTINRFFGLFVGISTITGLSSIISNLINETAETNDSYVVYKILALIVFSGFLIVFPGTMLMAYRYFSLGDHANGVNFLRYNLSRDEHIGVGTIQGHYQKSYNLPEPISPYIRKSLKLDQPKKGKEVNEFQGDENQSISEFDESSSSGLDESLNHN